MKEFEKQKVKLAVSYFLYFINDRIQMWSIFIKQCFQHINIYKH